MIDIEVLSALTAEAYALYRRDIRCSVNSHDSFFKWQELKEQLETELQRLETEEA